MEPTLKTNTYERGTYYFFDCLNWRKIAKVRIWVSFHTACTFYQSSEIACLFFFNVALRTASIFLGLRINSIDRFFLAKWSLFCCNLAFLWLGKIVFTSLRNFIWSMTSWKKGLMCQQHSTTTQPSRPSKAQTSPKATAVPAHNTVVQRGRCGSCSLVFIPRGFWLFDCGGWCHHKKLPCLSRLYAAQNTNTCSVFIPYVPPFFVLFWAGSVLCLRLRIWSLFFSRMEDWPRGTWQWQNKGYASYFQQMYRTEKAGKAKLSKHHPQKQEKGWQKCNVYCCTIFSNKRTQNLFLCFF